MKLEGIRVIDLSGFLPGPYLTLAMADHGAEVIKASRRARAIRTSHRSLGRTEHCLLPQSQSRQ